MMSLTWPCNFMFFFSFGSKLLGSKTFQGSDCSLAQRKQGDEETFSHLEHTADVFRELSALLCVPEGARV